MVQNMDLDPNGNELHHEKTKLFAYVKTKGADQLHSNHAADQGLCFRYKDSTMPLPKFKISSLLPSVAVQPGLCPTLSGPLKTGLLMTWLK